MKGRGDALMGIGIGEGSNRAIDAARAAINNPLLENASIDGASSVLVNLAGGDGLTLQEYQDVVELITENCAEDALIIAGQAYNPELGEKIKVTVVATGFESSDSTLEDHVDLMTYKRRKVEGPAAAPKNGAPREERNLTDESENVISVNRWQDLQQQLGSRQKSDDYNFPAVLRYQRGEEEDS
jgi:cell division protein FtsZ